MTKPSRKELARQVRVLERTVRQWESIAQRQAAEIARLNDARQVPAPGVIDRARRMVGDLADEVVARLGPWL